MPKRFAKLRDARERERSTMLAPAFNADGLVTCVVTDAGDGTVLMLAHMNDEALALTLDTGIAHFWSRSRAKLWKKGETSGNQIHIDTVRIDCDQDAVWIAGRVAGDGVACHTEARSCFFRKVERDAGTGEFELVHEE